MMSNSSICICRPVDVVTKPINKKMDCALQTIKLSTRVVFVPRGTSFFSTTSSVRSGVCGVRASVVDSYESSSNFVKRTEQAWLISQQPRPVACSSCGSNGHIDCKWCAGTGFFIIGDNMLCQVPSRNTTCVICAGKGSMCCSDCKGTGFRAKWLGEPPISK